jgi:hypothetical protein
MGDLFADPIKFAEDIGVGGLGIWFIEYLLAPTELIMLWPDETSRRIVEGALVVLLWYWGTGTLPGSTSSIALHAAIGGVGGYYVVYALKGQ